MTLGGVFGSLLGGTLIDALSIPSMLLIATIISAAGSLLVVVFTEKEKAI
jgi:predicted MFS family arabinose efflux permease